MNRLLTTALFSLLAIIVLGTLAAFATKRAHPGEDLRRAEPIPSKLSPPPDARPSDGTTAYMALGQIRSATKQDENAASVVLLTSWMSYPATDSPFFDELAQKNRRIKSLITEYFASHTQSQLISAGEEAIKRELTAQINAELVLGDITGLYFDEYIFFD
jgi:flagellar basal body-associated protein FliL